MRKLQLSSILSQRDPQWSSVVLGFNTDPKYNLGNYGCLVTCLAMYCKSVGYDETPATLNEKLKQVNGFVNGGNYVWDSLKKIYPDLGIFYQSPKYEDAVPDTTLDKCKSLIDSGYLLFAEIDFYPATVNEDMHYVLIYGYDDSNWYVADPWSGTTTVLSVYGEIKRVLYRITCYSKKLPFQTVQVELGQEIFDKLVHNSDNWDKTVSYLGITTDPKDTSFEQVQSVVGGIRSTATSAQNDAKTLASELENRVEQVGRLKKQVLDEQKLRSDLTTSLNDAVKKYGDTSRAYEGQLAIKQEKIDSQAKRIGDLNNQLALLKAGQVADSILTKIWKFITRR